MNSKLIHQQCTCPVKMTVKPKVSPDKMVTLA